MECLASRDDGAVDRRQAGLQPVRLDVTDQIIDLPRSSFDAAIRGIPRPSPGLVSHFLMRMPVTPLASPSFLATHRLKAPKDLLSVPRLSPEDDWWDLFAAWAPDKNFSLTAAYVQLGHIVPAVATRRQDGGYISGQIAF